MIRGVGIDSVEIPRVAAAMARPGWLERVFADEECTRLRGKGLPPETVAGRFAAKEAVSKALGFSLSPKGFCAIMILRDGGRPEVVLSEELKEELKLGPADRLHVSISHDKGRAVALAVWENTEEGR